MRKERKRKIILIDGIRYYEDRPANCRGCFFWKNRKVGCILGKQNCYYLAEAVISAFTGVRISSIAWYFSTAQPDLIKAIELIENSEC